MAVDTRIQRLPTSNNLKSHTKLFAILGCCMYNPLNLLHALIKIYKKVNLTKNFNELEKKQLIFLRKLA